MKNRHRDSDSRRPRIYNGPRDREEKTSIITRFLQLLLVAATLAGLVIYGFISDKREHPSTAKPINDAQDSLPFPSNNSPDHEHRGAAKSRI